MLDENKWFYKNMILYVVNYYEYICVISFLNRTNLFILIRRHGYKRKKRCRPYSTF